MTPTSYRSGAMNTVIRFAAGQCSLGDILVAQSERGVCAIFMGDDPDELVRDMQDRFPLTDLIGEDAAFERVVAMVIGGVESPGWDLICRSTFAGRLFRNEYGKRCGLADRRSGPILAPGNWG